MWFCHTEDNAYCAVAAWSIKIFPPQSLHLLNYSFHWSETKPTSKPLCDQIVFLNQAVMQQNSVDWARWYTKKIPEIHCFVFMEGMRFPTVLEHKLILCKTLEIAVPGKGLEASLQRVFDNSFPFSNGSKSKIKGFFRTYTVDAQSVYTVITHLTRPLT